MLIKRFSEKDNSKSLQDKTRGAVIGAKDSIVKAGKFVKNYQREHGTHETVRAGVKVAGNYVKEHPDEAAAMIGSYTVVPWLTNKALNKAVKNPTLRKSIAGATALLPLGESYVAWKVARRLKKQGQQKDKN